MKVTEDADIRTSLSNFIKLDKVRIRLNNLRQRLTYLDKSPLVSQV